MLAAVEEHGWDGDWYLRAYDAAGQPVGSHVCDEGQIFVESQAWCVLGGAGRDNGRARQALESVHEHLCTQNGIVLHQPAYTRYHLELGEITSYPPGYKENAGIFCHDNTWITSPGACWAKASGRSSPTSRSAPSAHEDQIETYRCEPYVFAQMIAGRDAATSGRGEELLADRHRGLDVRRDRAGHPRASSPTTTGCASTRASRARGPSYRVTRRFRGTVYEIAVENPAGVCRGVASLRVDGEPVDGNLVRATSGRERVRVELTLGLRQSSARLARSVPWTGSGGMRWNRGHHRRATSPNPPASRRRSVAVERLRANVESGRPRQAGRDRPRALRAVVPRSRPARGRAGHGEDGRSPGRSHSRSTRRTPPGCSAHATFSPPI